ncbi:hypothetical protein GOP47_0008867 [Adiantum capillus-veneris]|uniref:Peptidase A1 domain-containing protein n=1 Tax=Adiantum capillus-veneris TaxID=13818 RepID=A0A9D4UZY1_ADICA|nr:hypothetical protein GOP47_0008867 [Adiantum capillus-veneris]
METTSKCVKQLKYSCLQASCKMRMLIVVLLLVILRSDVVVAELSGMPPLVASIRYDTDSNSYFVELPLGTPAQTMTLKADLTASIISVRCSEDNSSAATATFHAWQSSTFTRLRAAPPQPVRRSSANAHDTLTLSNITTFSLNIPMRTPVMATRVDVAVPRLELRCTPASSSSPLLAGVVALGNSSLALPAQLAKLAGISSEIAYCLPSSEYQSNSYGPIIFGSSPNGYIFQNFPDYPINVSAAALPRTPLFAMGSDYGVEAIDITVGGESIGLAQPIRMRVNTAQPYTRLPTYLYRKVREISRRKVGYGNQTVPVAAVAPFDICFNITAISDQLYFMLASLGRLELSLAGGLPGLLPGVGDKAVGALQRGCDVPGCGRRRRSDGGGRLPAAGLVPPFRSAQLHEDRAAALIPAPLQDHVV